MKEKLLKKIIISIAYFIEWYPFYQF